MNCSKAHEYFMKHIDNCLSSMEAEWLDKHLMKCEKCREDFVAYEAVLGAILEENVEAVPGDLEMKIMKQVEDLTLAEKGTNVDEATCKLHLHLGISFAATMALIPIVIMRWDVVLEAQASLRESLELALGYIRVYTGDSIARIPRVSDMRDIFFERFRNTILFVTMTLIFIQLTLWRKSRAMQ